MQRERETVVNSRDRWLRRGRDAVSRRTPTGARRGVLAIVSGSAAGQAIVLLTSPILTRLYSPDSFGIYFYILSICTIVSAVSSLRLDVVIPFASELDEARSLTRASLISAVGFALMSALALLVFHRRFSQGAGFEVFPWAWWAPALILVTSWFVTLNYAALRDRAYTAVATRNLVQSGGVAAWQLSAAFVTNSAGGLLTGQLLGRCLGVVSLARVSRELLVRPAKRSMGRTLRKYWRFPVYFAPSGLLNTLGSALPLILVGAWFGAGFAGYLGLAQRIALAPTALLGNAIGQVFTGELSSRLRDKQYDNRRLYLRTSRKLAIVGAGVGLALLVFAPLAFTLVFGEQWSQAGNFAQAMACSVGLGLVASPTSYVYDAYQKARTNLLLDVSRILLVGGSGIFAHLNGFSAVETVWAMFTGQALNYVLAWPVALHFVSAHERSDTGGPIT